MDVRIGFLHNQDKVKLALTGAYSVVDCDDHIISTLKDCQLELSLERGRPATYNWYDKIDTFYDIEQMEEVRDKYFFRKIPVRIVKVGSQISEKLDNFEYWVLKKKQKAADIYYERGDYRCKKIIRKEASGLIMLGQQKLSRKVRFIPQDEHCNMRVAEVQIGIGFHWDHREVLVYEGELDVIIDQAGKLTVINVIDLETYLASVNSSEMRNDNSIEMLKAQTVAARGTVLATMGKHHFQEGFDLCADDHCQCYQGSKRVSDLSRNVCEATRGEVLFFDHRICDTRYAKICGGITERYSTCWEDQDFPYFKAVCDDKSSLVRSSDGIADTEATAFIDQYDLDCFCNTKRHTLPPSLAFCNDTFRWQEVISLDKMNELVDKQISQDIGSVTDLVPLKRGSSGRISHLKIVGDNGDVVVSKELKIRNLLSDTHLLSSCFYVVKITDDKGHLCAFELHGAGWGHGVGLCQVGAQVMGEQGYLYEEILQHYYRSTTLKKLSL